MSHSNHSKKPALTDWHKADIKAALEKSGWSLSRLSKHHGYKSRCQLKHALAQPWPKGERLIAAAIGVAPEAIWPTRYSGKKPNCQCTAAKPARNSAQREAA